MKYKPDKLFENITYPGGGVILKMSKNGPAEVIGHIPPWSDEQMKEYGDSGKIPRPEELK